jgi:tetracycline resistance efflux pump
MDSWVVLIPTILTIAVCLWTKRVYLGLFVGVLAGSIILAWGNLYLGISGAFDQLINSAASAWNLKIILFSVLMGGMIGLVRASGGVNGLILWLQKKAKINGPKSSMFFIWLIGVVLFFDQVTSEAVTGTIGKQLSDKHGFSHEMVAYLVDSTASPMCAFLPINSWGAYIISLLAAAGVADSFSVMTHTLLYNYYCLFALIVCLVAAINNWSIGPMKKFQAAAAAKAVKENGEDRIVAEGEKISSPWNFLVPLLLLIASIPTFMLVTGKGVYTDGDSSTAVYYGVLIGLGSAYLLALKAGVAVKDAAKACKDGIMEMVPIGVLLVFAYSLSSICSTLGVGAYVSKVTAAYLPNLIVPLIVFLVSCLMAFASGSSWGTFAIMTPIVVPMAQASGISISILMGAMLSGAIMGDHCAIMSDSTVLASSFSGCNNVDHFRTQLPYALIATGAASVCYLIVGIFVL